MNITPENDKGQRHGLWELYYYGSELMYRGFYHNGKKVGYDEIYWHSGKLTEKIYHL
jgi:antitoxin component YwqK of YwqJK toxin-antitoxin module